MRESAPVFVGTITACAVGDDALYVACADGGIRKFARPGFQEDPRFREGSRAIGLGRPFVGIATDAFGRVYAVAGEPAVYRFSSRGEADQRACVSIQQRVQESEAPRRPTPLRLVEHYHETVALIRPGPRPCQA